MSWTIHTLRNLSWCSRAELYWRLLAWPNLKCIVIVVDKLCNVLTPLSRLLLEKAAGPQLVKLPTFYDPVLSQINPVQAPPLTPASWRLVLTSARVRIGLTSGRVSLGFFITSLYAPLLSPIVPYAPSISSLGYVIRRKLRKHTVADVIAVSAVTSRGPSLHTPNRHIQNSDVWGFFENLLRKLRKSGWNLTRITGTVLNISMNS
jgi:hypothetical protein